MSDSKAQYIANTASYHVKRATTLGHGPLLTGTLVAGLTLLGGIDYVNNDLDTVGTAQQETVMQQLEESKTDVLTNVREYQTALRTQNATPTDENKAVLTQERQELKDASLSFFGQLLTNGSMQDGLDISEADAKTLLQDLKSEARDFNWGTHVNSAIPGIFDNGINYAENLDEVRTEHRSDGTESVSDAFATASNMAYMAERANGDDGLAYFGFVILSIIMGAVAGTTLNGKRYSTNNLRKPTPPAPKKYH